MPFAQATGGGSFYALWSDGQTKTTSDMPVVVFGDEGGAHVVAENVRGLLQLLTYGVEPMVSAITNPRISSPPTPPTPTGPGSKRSSVCPP